MTHKTKMRNHFQFHINKVEEHKLELIKDMREVATKIATLSDDELAITQLVLELKEYQRVLAEKDVGLNELKKRLAEYAE